MLSRFNLIIVSAVLLFFLATACGPVVGAETSKRDGAAVEAGPSENLVLPKPYTTPSVRDRSQHVGYKVVFVPFEGGKPKEEIKDFLTGFTADKQAVKVYGRPVDVTVLPDGSLLVTDDRGGKVWRVSYTAAPTFSRNP